MIGDGDIRKSLREVAEFLRTEGEVVGYGYGATANPHDFTPDPECCTEDEIARHKAACDAWDRGDYTPPPSTLTEHATALDASRNLRRCIDEGAATGIVFKCDDGSAFVHCHRAGWGIGSYVVRDEWMMDAAKRLDEMADDMPAFEADEADDIASVRGRT